ncbi:MAG: ImmA/IrrE family metallo-endopeptidase [Chitinophagaceae bacterium]|nr:ImmA/IrrE family metallo-endopeptidase [Chitinophagaceae bacterium]
MKGKINQRLIIIARETRGLTQYELAEKLEISPAHMSKMELGSVEIYEEYIDKLVDILDYPKSFFYQEYEPMAPILNHRRRNIVAQKLITQIDAQINVYSMHISKVSHELGMRFNAIPCIDSEKFGSPFNCAKELRRIWKLKEPVIDNLTKIIEEHGIMIVSFNFGTDRVDSRTVITPDGQAIIFVNKSLLGDRLRFSLAYELAHLIMHHCAMPSMDRDIGSEANKFAAEFLMPEKDIKKDMKETVNLDLLGKLKVKYKVSMQSLVYRADDLEIITDNQKRYLIQQFNQLKIRKREPQEYDVAKEVPSSLRNLLAQFKTKHKADAHKMAELLHISHAEFVQLYL